MTIRADILEARDKYTRHVSRHKCCVGDGCTVRIAFWHAYMGTADMWGRETDDAERCSTFYALPFDRKQERNLKAA
jgi:hypothetical protein